MAMPLKSWDSPFSARVITVLVYSSSTVGNFGYHKKESWDVLWEGIPLSEINVSIKILLVKTHGKQ